MAFNVLYGTKNVAFMTLVIDSMLHFPDSITKNTYPLLLSLHISPQCVIHWHFLCVKEVFFIFVTKGMTKTILLCHLGIALPVYMGLFTTVVPFLSELNKPN